jgi:hypothetical protein
MSEFEKLQKDIEKSKQKSIVPQDNLDEIKKKLGNKYIDDISDSDNDELSTYKERHNNFIKQNVIKVNQQPKVKNNKLIIKDENIQKSISKNIDESESENESEDESNELSITEYEFKEEFEKLIKEYVKIDNEIRELKLKMKGLNIKKDANQEEIMKHLDRLGDNYVKINGGALRINQYESKAGLKEDLIKESIQDKVKNPKLTEEIMNIISDKRETNKKIQKSLKRTYERGDKK